MDYWYLASLERPRQSESPGTRAAISFVVNYKNGDGQPKVVRVPGHEDQVTISGLEPDHKYKMNLYGIHSGQRVGPVSVVGVTGEWTVGPIRKWDLLFFGD